MSAAKATEAAVTVLVCDFTGEASRRQLRERIGDKLFIRSMYARQAPAARYRAARFVAVLIGRAGRTITPLLDVDELLDFLKLLSELSDWHGGPEVIPLDLEPVLQCELEAAVATAVLQRLGDIEMAGHG